jgi:hypothetical protein
MSRLEIEPLLTDTVDSLAEHGLSKGLRILARIIARQVASDCETDGDCAAEGDEEEEVNG